MKFYNQKMLSSVVMNANINSAPEQLMEIFGYSIQAVWTGTPTGTFKLQGSSDPVSRSTPQPLVPGPTNWSDIANSSQAVAAAGDFMWNVEGCFYNWVRLVYTDGSGGASTAVLNVTFNGKGA